MSLTDAHIEVLRDLYDNDPEVQKFIADKVQARIDEAQKQVKELEKAADLFGSKQTRRSAGGKASSKAGSKAGSKNHRPAIMALLASKPGLTIGELRQHLADQKHDIDKRVLASLMSTMRKEFVETKGEKGIRAEGEKPNTRYYAK
jgi:hypothetical protein